MTAAELVEVASSVTSSEAAARLQEGEGRRWVRMVGDDRHDAWVIAWPAGSSIEMHDHGGSIAAVRVVRGRLRERYVESGGRVVTRWMEPNETLSLPGDHIHQVINVGDTEAISVHVYSPALGEAGDPTPSDVDVAVVGAGASGLLTVIHLARAANGTPLEIALIDDAPPASVGLAYSTSSVDHLMNVRACGLSAFPDQPRHFVEWISRRDGTVDPHAFVPRRVYGEYLREVARDLPSNVRVHRVSHRCLRIREVACGALLHLDDGGRVLAGQVVLALGHARPVSFGGPTPVTIESPWRSGALDEIGSDDDVILIGTGLTSVDAVLQLESAGHRGQLHAISRHGRWPMAHTVRPPEWSGEVGLPTSTRPRLRAVVRAVRDAIAEAERAGEDWRGVIDSIRPHTVRLWRGFDDAERRQFERHLRSLWEICRHRMAPTAAARLESIAQSGRLTVSSGRVTRVRLDTCGERAVVELENAGSIGERRARWVINCTGPSADVRRRDDHLTVDLLATGMASAGWNGWGLDVDECGWIRGTDGEMSDVISAIGPMRLGAELETTAIPEIRAQALVCAGRTIRSLRDAVREEVREVGDVLATTADVA